MMPHTSTDERLFLWPETSTKWGSSHRAATERFLSSDALFIYRAQSFFVLRKLIYMYLALVFYFWFRCLVSYVNQKNSSTTSSLFISPAIYSTLPLRYTFIYMYAFLSVCLSLCLLSEYTYLLVWLLLFSYFYLFRNHIHTIFLDFTSLFLCPGITPFSSVV